jgi:predicted nucleic acid-binding protein
MNKISITRNSEAFLPEIKKLWRKHSSKLGFFPEGAFEDYCISRQILAAHSGKDELLGYLLFRHSRGDIVIVHLCVNSAFRSTGIAKLLVNKLKDITSDSRGIGLKCRRDYGLEGFWAALGFIAMNEVQGKGSDFAPLTLWWMDFGHPDLLSIAARDHLVDKTCLVIDANIFYGIYSNKKEDEESKSLVADWLPENIELCLTDEIFNEINRRDAPEERIKNRRLTQSFTFIPSGATNWETVEIDLLNLLPSFKTESGRSDIRHLAKSIAGDALYFITRDQDILKHSDLLYDRFQIAVLRPCELVLQLDHIERGHAYQPARLSGSQYRLRLIMSGELDTIVDKFVCRTMNERPRDFKKLLVTALSNPRVSACYVLESPTGEQQGLFITQITSAEIMIPIFRISRTPLSTTIGRHLLRRLSLQAARESKSFITITDGFIDDGLTFVLANDGFILAAGNYTKVLLRSVINFRILDKCLSDLAMRFHEKESPMRAIRERAAVAMASKKNPDIIALERMLWPVKIVETDVPCFIVPIKPGWAKYLFDEHIASQDLFGSSDLIFNAELVYFRSKRPSGLNAPARILWYVSHEKNYPEAGGIRAISILEEVDVGTPKELYSRNRRLGVYQWKDIIKAAKNDLQKELMALRFSNTFMVEKPLQWKTLESTLHKFGIRTTLQSPLRIGENVFAEIVRKTISTKESDYLK